MSSDSSNHQEAVGDGSSNIGVANVAAIPSKSQELMGNLNPNKPKPTFASLFQDNRIPDEKCKLHYVPMEGDEVILSFEDIDTVENTLGYCLVGCVAGRKLNGFVVKEVIRRWGKNVKFQIHESGWITFVFDNDVERQLVLKGGPYLVFGRHLFLKEMPRCFLFRVEDMLTLPSWVQLHGLPGDCWTPYALSKVASIVGTPIHTDKITMTKGNGQSKFARMMVEVDASKPKIHESNITLPTGVKALVHFVYETDPKFCIDCNVLGHSKEGCYRNKNRAVEGDGGRGVEGVGEDVVLENRDNGVGIRVGNGEGLVHGNREGEGEARVGARSRSRNTRGRWNRQRSRGGFFGRGRGVGGQGRGGRGLGSGGGVAPEDVVGKEVVVDKVDDTPLIIVENVVIDNVGLVGQLGDVVGLVTEAVPILEVDLNLETTPAEGHEDVGVDDGVDDGFKEVSSKRKKKYIRHLKRTIPKGNVGSSSSTSTEFIELDPKTWRPRRNAKTFLMTYAQAEARRLRAAKYRL